MPSEFVFVPTPYSAELQEELAKALRARTEIISRKMNPKLWRMTDGVNRFAEANRADDPVLKRRKTVQTVLSVVLAAIGVFLLVTGLTEPRNTTLLAAGAIALVIAAAFPYVVYVLRDLLDIEMPVNLVFLLMFCFVLVVLLSLSIAISQLADKCKRLTQANAMLEKRVRDLEEKK